MYAFPKYYDAVTRDIENYPAWLICTKDKAKKKETKKTAVLDQTKSQQTTKKRLSSHSKVTNQQASKTSESQDPHSN